ncbi:MAG TPA: hypothetical protein IAD32_02510 [Candidatus Scatavimonas merdigallinarum]|uniref:Uncharacterized protein n=1 Tax=Candidatus Scatavimonas merdigallinarum TaxID=2840914 RepID=A0A9D0ZGS8_9FIRM|nr:hypothetical protein [Candidatus Scatavimonas merdigallinarum]
MPTDFWIAVLALAGTLIGSGGGILAASRLTNYRIRQLEKRVEKHNSVVERTALLEKEINVANHRIKDLEEEMRKNEY